VCVCVCVCDLETSKVRRPGPKLGCDVTVKVQIMQLFVELLCILLFRPLSRAKTSLGTLSSNTLSQCSSLMCRPCSTPIQYSQQTVTVFAMFLDSQRPDRMILERTVADIPTVSSVSSCFVVALGIAGVAGKYLNWHLVVLHCVRKTAVFASAGVAQYPDCVCVCACCVAVRQACRKELALDSQEQLAVLPTD